MEIREALQRQSPSLALQRAAANEIARLDACVTKMQADNDARFVRMKAVVTTLERQLESANEGIKNERHGS